MGYKSRFLGIFKGFTSSETLVIGCTLVVFLIRDSLVLIRLAFPRLASCSLSIFYVLPIVEVFQYLS